MNSGGLIMVIDELSQTTLFTEVLWYNFDKTRPDAIFK